MTYRKIEVSKEAPQTPADQPAPMLEWVRIDRMVIDETYQRDLTPGEPFTSYHKKNKLKVGNNHLRGEVIRRTCLD